MWVSMEEFRWRLAVGSGTVGGGRLVFGIGFGSEEECETDMSETKRGIEGRFQGYRSEIIIIPQLFVFTVPDRSTVAVYKGPWGTNYNGID